MRRRRGKLNSVALRQQLSIIFLETFLVFASGPVLLNHHWSDIQIPDLLLKVLLSFSADKAFKDVSREDLKRSVSRCYLVSYYSCHLISAHYISNNVWPNAMNIIINLWGGHTVTEQEEILGNRNSQVAPLATKVKTKWKQNDKTIKKNLWMSLRLFAFIILLLNYCKCKLTTMQMKTNKHFHKGLYSPQHLYPPLSWQMVYSSVQ